MDEDGALFDSGFDGAKPFRDTPEAGGISLESALHDFGPAAIDDLIPRVRSLAVALDAAHASGAVHGALHPSKVIISDESTSLISGTSSSAPYVAPEVADGQAPTPASDQYALAAITYEWLFGKPIARPAARPVEVRNMPGVERGALSAAFTRALSPDPKGRFDSCNAFCDRLADSVVPELPLLALEPDNEPDALIQDWPSPDEAKIVAEEATITAASFEPDPDFDAFERETPSAAPIPVPVEEPAFEEPAREPAPVAWQSAMETPATPARNESARFGGAALILAAIVGAIFGFAAGYMARPRALQTGPEQTMAVAPPAERANEPAPAAPETPAPKAQEAPKAPQAPAAAPGRILVRSNPPGASVTIDGVARGVTPLALRDLELGTRSITVTRRGFIAETRTVAITAERPSRSLDVRLTAAATAVQKPAPATAKPAVSTGVLVVESRPTGAAVSINGAPRGSTPLTLTDLAPGEYRVLMTLPGFRNFATTVRVVAGERVRAAASLTAQEQE
ncbi:MAG TPA: PEGA domain-containing protein [Vicinamibacterales bacterium]|nr:PEGA domain-containing protein [Vicinamibacterales bacterium]